MNPDDLRHALHLLESSIRAHPRLGPMARRERCPACRSGRVEEQGAGDQVVGDQSNSGLRRCLDCGHRFQLGGQDDAD